MSAHVKSRSLAAAIGSLLVLVQPSAVLAMTTQQEIDWGKDISREVIAEQGALSDPLLSRWVNDIGQRLVGHTVRADVPYTFHVINSEEVNAFSIPGGYVFVDAGLLNFVHSDDELAGVLGHEIGHVERRHVVTLDQKAKALEIILDVAGIFVPGVSRFGNLAGDLILFKLSRVVELQADQYGLKLMSQAGYDPDGMLVFLERLQKVDPEHKSLLGRYFETHPALGDRVKHLKGYAELDRPPADVVLAQAIHDYGEGWYYTARQKFARVLAARPNDALALDYQRRLNALFAPVANDPRLRTASLRARADADIAASQADAETAKHRLKRAHSELDEYEKYLVQMGYYVDPQSRIGIPRGSRLDRILNGQAQIGQYMDHSYDQVSQTIAQAQDIADADLTLAKDLRKLVDHPDPAAPIDELEFSTLLSRVEAVHGAVVRAVDAARGAMAVGWQQGKTVSTFIADFDKVSDYKSGDMPASDYRNLRMPLHWALVAAQSAARASDITSGLLNDAQSLETLDRIALAAPLATAARRAAFSTVLARRFGVEVRDTTFAISRLADPGDVAAAAIVSAETGSPLRSVATAMKRERRSPTAYASSAGVRPETLQLELGLVWLSYSSGETASAH